jgi:hypothetical protein
MEAGSKILESGSKARQREDTEDRNLPFSNALRQYGVPATDVDFVVTNGKDEIKLVIEVTRPDEEVFSPTNYLAAIDSRRRDQSSGNHNDTIISEIARKLGARAMLVVFEPNVCEETARIWWRWVDGTEWTARPAKQFFENVRKFAVGA